MMLSRHARWSAAAALLVAAPASAQTAKPPDIPAVGTVWTAAATLRTALPEKPTTEAEFRYLRRVIEAGADWFKVEFDIPFQGKKFHYREKHSADPFAPPLTKEHVPLTAQGEGATLKLIERSDGAVTGSLFPLEIGKVAQYRYATVAEAGEVPAVSDCKVESRGSVTVPLGTYDAFAVRCRAAVFPREDVRIDTETLFHYAGDLGADISVETHITSTKVSEMKVQHETWIDIKLAQIEKPP
jgi:hypothetical protein